MKRILFICLFILLIINPCFGQSLIGSGMIGGINWSNPGAIGSTTPNTGMFTSLTDTGLTATRVPFAGTGGLLADDADMTFATDTLTVTKIIGSTSLTSPAIYGSSASGGNAAFYSTSHSTKGNISIGRLTLSDLANSNGIVFGSLGTATKMIDGSASELSGTDDWIYLSSTNYWRSNGILSLGVVIGTIPGNAIYLSGIDLDFRPNRNSTFQLVANRKSILFGNLPTPVGSLTACSSNGTTTITKITHGLTLAAGELVHITESSTSVDFGFYRYVSGDANTIVVDRALSGTQTNVALTVYKDVISMHATDATEGQMLTSWSAQNKPLQLGGTVLAATGHSLTSPDILVGGKLEVDGAAYFDGTVELATALPAISGGTGLATYTTGDILYASASNTLLQLAAGTSGYVLKMGATLPAWSNTLTGTFGGFTASKALSSDASGNIAIATTTLAELNYLAGVTSPTGSGALVLGTSPTFTTKITTPAAYISGDIGSGVGSTLGLSNATDTTTTNAYVVGGGQTATTKNTGWAKVYIGTDVAWIPYWVNATP